MFELLVLVLLAFFAGYIIGKKNGRILGEQEFRTAYPLTLRQQSYEKGYCLLCRETVSQSKDGKEIKQRNG